MNMKKYLLISLAALGFAACNQSDDIDSPAHNGEVEESYIAISLSAADKNSTRAEDGVYQEGLADERAVETAYFFFFKENGDAFPVTITDNSVSAPGEAKNYLQASLTTTTGKDMNNVSDIKNVVLLLKNYVGEYPAKIVAVLNWVPDADEGAYSLEELQKTLIEIRSNAEGGLKGKFVMSNAVYAKEGTSAEVINATPLTPDDIFTDEANAKANPVTIYVERAAAKVTVTTTDGKTVFNLNKPVTIGSSSTPVYANILGWELYNDYQQSYLLKGIEPTWTNDGLGFTWNDSPWYRCYWANSPISEFPDNTFQYQYLSVGEGHNSIYGYGIGKASDVTGGTYADKTYTYCGENTNREEADRTKIILKAQLQKENGDEVELARWYSTEYLGEEDLRKAVANTLKYTLYYKAEGNYVGLRPEDLQCVAPVYDQNGIITNGAPNTIKPYQVFFQLSTAAQTQTWYTRVEGEMKEMTKDITSDPYGATATNAYLSANVEPAILYKSGQTYYYIDIQHLGNVEDNVEKPGHYGVVRNHIYSVNINSIGGYGSPIYVPTSPLIDPEYPEVDDEEKSFVAAEVRILSWRLVSQEVDIQPQPTPDPTPDPEP